MFSMQELDQLVSELQNKTQIVNYNLQTLVDNIVKTRQSSVISIPAFNSDYQDVRVGFDLIVNPYEFTFTFTSIPNVVFNSQLIWDISYEDLTDDSIIYKGSFNNYLDKLKATYVTKDTKEEIIFKYDVNIDFQSDDIPSVKWYKNNFYTKDTDTLDTLPVLARSPHQAEDDSAITFDDVNEFNAVNLLTSQIDVNISNLVQINNLTITPYNFAFTEGSFTQDVFLKNCTIQSAQHFNSVITYDYLKENYIHSNLANLREFYILPDENSNYSLIDKITFSSILGSYNLSKGLITLSSSCIVTYLTNPEIPRSPMADVMAKFEEIDSDYVELKKDPQKYIYHLTQQGPTANNEFVTLSTIKAIIVLALNKEIPGFILTDEEAKQLKENESILIPIDTYKFEVPITIRQHNACDVGTLKDILNAIQ